MKVLFLIGEKIKSFKKFFSWNFFLRFNWVLTVLFFVLVLFFALLVWWKNFRVLSSPVSSGMIEEENSQELEEKNQKIKKVMEELEKRKSAFDNFPESALPREKVFKSDFVWEEETAPGEEEIKSQKEKTEKNERLVF